MGRKVEAKINYSKTLEINSQLFELIGHDDIIMGLDCNQILSVFAT